MKPTARIYAFSVLWLGVGLLLGALCMKDIATKQAQAAYASRLEAADARCQQFSACVQDMQTWRVAFETCSYVSSLEDSTRGAAPAGVRRRMPRPAFESRRGENTRRLAQLSTVNAAERTAEPAGSSRGVLGNGGSR